MLKYGIPLVTAEGEQMPRSSKTASEQGARKLVYKDEKGNILYGFSQENLERTNRELRRTNSYLMVLTVLVLVMLGIFVASLIWADLNNVITAMIYR